MGQLEEMHILVRVVEAGGISMAADQLGIAKSAVSRRLAELEQRLGVTLINRTTRTSSITEAGQLYYQRALRILDDIQELNTLTSDPNAALRGTLRLAAPVSFGLKHLAPALDVLAKDHPQMTLNVDFSDQQIDLIEGGYDVAFRIGELADSSLKARRICPIRFVLCASPEYLQQHGYPHSPNDLKNHHLLRYTLAGISSWRLIDKQNRVHEVSVDAKVLANNGDFLCNMAIAGHGILFTPSFIAWEALAMGDLLPVLPDYHLHPMHAYAIYPKSRTPSQRVRLLIDYLLERFGDKPYWDQD